MIMKRLILVFCCLSALESQRIGSSAFLSPLHTRRPFLPPSVDSSTTTATSRLYAKTAKKRLEKNKKWGGGGRKPSKVQDPDGPTPELEQKELEQVDPDSVVGLKDLSDPNDIPRPIEHQPWRLGETDGCDEPIAAVWRREAEDIIQKAVSLVGGRVLDVTWYLTQVVVTLDEEIQPVRDLLKSSGPVIDIVEPSPPTFYDPADPDPEPIWDDEDDILYQHETEEEAAENMQRKNNTYAAKDEDDPEDEPHMADHVPDDDIPLYMNEEVRSEVALRVTEEEQERYEDLEKPIDVDNTLQIDTAALSTIAKAILDALEEREDELRILARHELILTSPGSSDVIETQRQFDAFRGFDVIVETQDPFESNRTLKGKLVDRNSMDLIINKKGRMVTIPLNFVKCVRLPPAKREKGVPRDVPF